MPTTDSDKVKTALQKVVDWIEMECDMTIPNSNPQRIKRYILAMIEGIESI